MEVNFLTLSDFTPLMICIGIIVLIAQYIMIIKVKSMANMIPLCVLVFALFVSSLAPAWNIGSSEFQKVMSDLMYYFCISSIGDIVAWLIYYIYCLVGHKY